MRGVHYISSEEVAYPSHTWEVMLVMNRNDWSRDPVAMGSLLFGTLAGPCFCLSQLSIPFSHQERVFVLSK